MYDERVNYDKLISDLDNIDSISELDEEQVIKLKEKINTPTKINKSRFIR